MRSRTPIRHLIQQVVLSTVTVFRHRSIFLAHGFRAKMVQATIGNNAINPGINRALEAKASDVLVSLEEGVLIDVLGVVLSAGEMERQPQNRLIVVTHQFLEGGAVPALRLADEDRIVDGAFLPSHAAPSGVQVLAASVTADLFRSILRSRKRPFTNRTCYY